MRRIVALSVPGLAAGNRGVNAGKACPVLQSINVAVRFIIMVIIVNITL